jgi:hypothetical protein
VSAGTTMGAPVSGSGMTVPRRPNTSEVRAHGEIRRHRHPGCDVE